MGRHNSLETYVSLTVHLYHDIAQCYPISEESVKDLRKLKARCQTEGVSFLTKTLPKLGKAIDFALSSDTQLRISGFSLIPGTSIPRFLGWLISRVFSSDGYVRSDPDITALKHLRQFLYFLYKLNLPYDPETERSVIESFVRTQEELENIEFPPEVEPVIRKARDIISRIFHGINVRDIVPRHGPGAVATGERAGEKSNFSRIYAHTEVVYPFTEYYMLGLNQVVDQFDWLQSLTVLEHGTAEVVLVPKDSRGPRLISKEPLELQWIQQGIQKQLYAWIEKHPWTSSFVNFTDQTRNRMLALASSRSNEYVTLDMKDASDRVTLRLVERLFEGVPNLLEALKASRSGFTRLPDGREVKLATFAPMGSACCFPIEAMCFYALAAAVISSRRSLEVRGRYQKYLPYLGIYVYGDDIIVRREDYPPLLTVFPKVGLRFNQDKCCVGRFFRESCGCDAFDGVEVTPIRLRTEWSHRGHSDAKQLVSYVELSNSLWAAGYWRTASAIQGMVESLWGKLPYVREKFKYTDPKGEPLLGSAVPRSLQPSGLAGQIKEDSPSLIGWYRPHVHQLEMNKRLGLKRRFNRDLHRLEYHNWIVHPKTEKFEVDGWREMLRVLTANIRKDISIRNPNGTSGADLGVYALPRRICLRRGWVGA